jgi:hypothetical protein
MKDETMTAGNYLRIVAAQVNSIALMHDARAPFTLVEMNAFKSRRCWLRLLSPVPHIMLMQA